MIRRAHDQIECGFRGSWLEHELKKMFVIHAPFFELSMRNHLIAAVNVFESLFATEFADSLPTEKAAIKKSRPITKLFENRSRRGWQSASYGWLKIHERARKRQASNDHTEALDRADSG